MCSQCTWCQWDPQAKISSISKPWRDQGHQQRPQEHRTFKEVRWWSTVLGKVFVLGEALFLSLTVPLGTHCMCRRADEVNQWSSKQTNKTGPPESSCNQFSWVLTHTQEAMENYCSFREEWCHGNNEKKRNPISLIQTPQLLPQNKGRLVLALIWFSHNFPMFDSICLCYW